MSAPPARTGVPRATSLATVPRLAACAPKVPELPGLGVAAGQGHDGGVSGPVGRALPAPTADPIAVELRSSSMSARLARSAVLAPAGAGKLPRHLVTACRHDRTAFNKCRHDR